MSQELYRGRDKFGNSFITASKAVYDEHNVEELDAGSEVDAPSRDAASKRKASQHTGAN